MKAVRIWIKNLWILANLNFREQDLPGWLYKLRPEDLDNFMTYRGIIYLKNFSRQMIIDMILQSTGKKK